ncbi:type IV pilus assembly protein PilC [Parelusimicrobium proximum]|uniref:type II secretion system F family protein n=1 Tax=Parelusimicrobium proximum TaxID=3228953 RepID=UPI003D178366
MQKYLYKVQDGSGKEFKGTMAAESRDKAVLVLQEKGYIVLEVKAASGGIRSKKGGQEQVGKVPSHVLSFFAEQLSTLISGGVPLVRAISLLGEFSSNPNLGLVLLQIAKDLSSGFSLHSALAKHPKIFNHIWLSLVQAGEVGGQLPESLMQIATYIKTQDALKSKIITAVTYPAILFIMAVGVLFFFILVIVPTFKTIFDDFNMELPAITQFILFLSDLLRKHYIMLLLALTAIFVAFWMYIRTPVGKRNFHSFIINMPIFGGFIKNIFYERMLSTMATLLRSGVTIINVISVLEESFGSNVIIQSALRKAKKDVSEGKSISDAFRDTGAFPGIMTEMMRMGEESGRLPNIIITLSKFYNDQIGQFIARFSAVIDPILIVGVGLIIGIVVISIFMPIFKMSQFGSSM